MQFESHLCGSCWRMHLLMVFYSETFQDLILECAHLDIKEGPHSARDWKSALLNIYMGFKKRNAIFRD